MIPSNVPPGTTADAGGEVHPADLPIRLIPGERQASENVTDGIGLCLSGGGYRSMLFHLGRCGG